MRPFWCQKPLHRPPAVSQWTPSELSLTAQHTAAQLLRGTLSNKERNLKGVSLRDYHSLQPYFKLSIASQCFGRFYHRLISITHGANWVLINTFGRYNVVVYFIRSFIIHQRLRLIQTVWLDMLPNVTCQRHLSEKHNHFQKTAGYRVWGGEGAYLNWCFKTKTKRVLLKCWSLNLTWPFGGLSVCLTGWPLMSNSCRSVLTHPL